MTMAIKKAKKILMRAMITPEDKTGASKNKPSIRTQINKKILKEDIKKSIVSTL